MLKGCICLGVLLWSATGMAQFSDNFESADRIGQWQIFQSGDPVYYQSLMYGDSLLEGESLEETAGRLVIVCGPTYWYADVTGPYVYQMTWGDFTATTSVRSLDRNDLSDPPDHEYNSTGLILRNPDASGGQNYIMTNLGMQSVANGIGSESKTTFNSMSILYLDPDEHEGEVRIMRTGTVIRTYKRTAGDADFVLLDEFDRSDIPDTVQIGMVLNGYSADPDIRGEFEYIRFHGGDCRIVRNSEDDGISSLREAIDCANPGDTIRFDHLTLTDTIDLSTGPIQIDKDLVLLNPSPEPIVIRGSGLTTLVSVAPGVQVTVEGLHFVGLDQIVEQVILNQGILRLIDCTLIADLPEESTILNEGTLTLLGNCFFR